MKIYVLSLFMFVSWPSDNDVRDQVVLSGVEQQDTLDTLTQNRRVQDQADAEKKPPRFWWELIKVDFSSLGLVFIILFIISVKLFSFFPWFRKRKY